MLTGELIKKKALDFGASACGIGDIRYFEGCDPQRDPKAILPGATCVIVFAFRVPRALYQCMARGSQYYGYTTMGVKTMDEEFSEVFLLKMAGLIENEGYDACVQRNICNLRVKGDKTTNPEVLDTYELALAEPVAEGKVVPDVILDFAQAAEIAGLGSRSFKNTILSPEFGPFVRFVCIVTDAPLECDEPFTDNLCDRCMACAEACPGHALSEDGLDTWQCAVYYRGAHRSNPYMTEDTLRDEPDREAILNGDKRFDAVSARAIYPKLDFLPSQYLKYAPCLCGKKCDLACYEHLKAKGVIR